MKPLIFECEFQYGVRENLDAHNKNLISVIAELCTYKDTWRIDISIVRSRIERKRILLKDRDVRNAAAGVIRRLRTFHKSLRISDLGAKRASRTIHRSDTRHPCRVVRRGQSLESDVHPRAVNVAMESPDA